MYKFEAEAILAVLTPLRGNFGRPDPSKGPVRGNFGRPDPSWARLWGPSASNLGAQTLSDPSNHAFPVVFHTFQEIATFAIQTVLS